MMTSLQNARAQVAQIKGEIASLDTDIDKAQEHRAKVDTQISKSLKHKRDLKERLQRATFALDHLEVAEKTRQKQAEEKQKQIAVQAELLKRAAYVQRCAALLGENAELHLWDDIIALAHERHFNTLLDQCSAGKHYKDVAAETPYRVIHIYKPVDGAVYFKDVMVAHHAILKWPGEFSLDTTSVSID